MALRNPISRLLLSFILVGPVSCDSKPPPSAKPGAFDYGTEYGPVRLVVRESGDPKVDALVAKLVSPVPAPYPDGSRRGSDLTDWYWHPQVSEAYSTLMDMGPPIFPALVAHLRDDRYSFSRVWSAWRNKTVSDAIFDILAAGPVRLPIMIGGKSGRDSPKGTVHTPPRFRVYLHEKGPSAWAEHARTQSRVEVQRDYILGCIAKEKEVGFLTQSDEQSVLGSYQRRLEKLRGSGESR